MSLSAGWFWLLGGVIGAIRNATVKKFYKSDFDTEFVGPKKTAKPRPALPRRRVGNRAGMHRGCIRRDLAHSAGWQLASFLARTRNRTLNRALAKGKQA
jgi:hypothetical protein